MKKQLSLLLFTTLTLFSASTNKDFTLKDGKGVILNEPTNTFSTKIKSSDSLNTNIVLTLPDSTPEDNQILVVDSNGNLSWADNNATAGSDNQKVDKFVLEGNQIKLSLESDAEADKVIDLSSITAFLKASDIKDNLTSTDTNKALSAKQGKELKSLVDALNSSLSNHTSRTDNPHSVTKAQVGLANVDNTSDLNKPISTATQDAINNLDTKVTDINQSLSSKITDLNNSQSDNQAVDVLDFNGTHLTISLDNNDTNKTIYLDRNISSLSDINTTSLTDGQVLRYDNTTKTWSPFTLPEGTTVVDELNSTSTNQALSANQGKVLNTKISDVNGSVNSLTTTVSTNSGDITTLTTNLTDVNSSVTSQESKINDINQTTITNQQNIADVNTSVTENKTNISDINSTIHTELDTKVNTLDIVNNLASTDINKPLSANQGKVLKGLIEDVNSSATLWSESGGDISRVSGNVGIGTNTPSNKFTVEHNSTEDPGITLTSTKLIANPLEDQNHYFLANTMRVETPEDNDKYTRGLVGTSISVDKKGSGRVYVGETIQSLFYHRAGVGNYLGSIGAQSSVSGGSVGYITGISSSMYTSNDATVSNLIGISTYGSISSSNKLTTAKGAWIRSFAGDGNITNVYGLHIENMAGRGTDKSYSIYSDGGMSYFKDSVGIGTSTPKSSLQVSGYVQLDLTDGAPPAGDCDSADERGRMKVDNVNGKLYICVDSGWIAK